MKRNILSNIDLLFGGGLKTSNWFIWIKNWCMTTPSGLICRDTRNFGEASGKLWSCSLWCENWKSFCTFSRDLENSVKSYGTSPEERKSRDLTDKLFIFNIIFLLHALLFKCDFFYFIHFFTDKANVTFEAKISIVTLNKLLQSRNVVACHHRFLPNVFPTFSSSQNNKFGQWLLLMVLP